MDVTVATIVRNEAGRWLESALRCWTELTDRIVAVDDGSTDGTPDLLRDYGAEVHAREFGLMGNEAEARAFLWEKASEGSEWVLVLDADHTVADDFRPHVPPDADLVAFRNFDLWEPRKYRDDAWWMGHFKARPWCAKVPEGVDRWEWPTRGIHAGHFPMNLGKNPYLAPVECSLLHYGYANAACRRFQHEKYANLAEILTPKERFHASTIMDADPRLVPLPFEPRWELEWAS